MVIDGMVTHGFDELDGWRSVQLGKSQPDCVTDHRGSICRALAPTPCVVVAVYPTRRLVPQARDGRLQIGVTDTMKPEQLNWFGWVEQLRECFAEPLKPPEIVGEIDNRLLEGMRRLLWRPVDGLCGWFMSSRMSFFDRIHGLEPLTSAHLRRETNH
jgi:hypothetical protein